MADLVTNAASLKDRVTIQQYTEEQSAATGEVSFEDTAWVTSAETWGDVQTLSGRDYVTAQQSGYVASHRVLIRYRAGIRIKYTRFIVRGIKLYVVHVNNVNGKNRQLEVLCRSDEPQV